MSPEIAARPAPGARIPATVITGFLGAGKTSTIRHLLQNARGRRLALVINEFGEVGMDGDVLRGCSPGGCDDVMELANGCICCTVADDFLPTIGALLDRPRPPEHIIIETSGLALPKPLVQAFAWPEVRTRVTVDGVITVIDAAAVAAGGFAPDPAAVQAQRRGDPALDHENPLEEVFADQLSCADMALLNKMDLLDAAALHRAEAAVRAGLRPGARLIRTRHGRSSPDILLGLAAAAEDTLHTRPSRHDGAAEHDHDDFESFAVSLEKVSAPGDLARRIRDAVACHDILRVKGIAAVAGRPMRLVVQGVGPRVQHYFDRPWNEGETRATHLVVIGLAGLDRAAITAALAGA